MAKPNFRPNTMISASQVLTEIFGQPVELYYMDNSDMIGISFYGKPKNWLEQERILKLERCDYKNHFEDDL